VAEGLAAMMYGDGSGNTSSHYYAGVMKPKKKVKTMACKSKKKKGK
jgi:hypothetical protein